MNLNELNKIEEGIFSAIKDRFQQGSYQNKVQDIFIKDFVQDAITSLNNGLKSGLINPAVKSTGEPKYTNTNKPEPSQPNQQNTGNTAPAGQQYIGKIAPNAGPAPKPFATPTLTQPKTTVSTTTSSTSKPGDITKGGAGIKIKESSYDKMNRIFESIINIDEDDNASTISEFMIDWFSKYMQGVNWESKRPLIQQKLNKLQDEYPKNLNANLTDLARLSLALSKIQTPAGAPQEFSQARKQSQSSIEDFKAALDDLARSDPNAYNNLIRTLKPVTVT